MLRIACRRPSVPAQQYHHVLVPERQQPGILGQIPPQQQDREPEYPANQQVDDREHHPASQPSLTPGHR